MFASQLLRILQTIPSNVNYETCVFDPAEEHMIMKERSPNEALPDSESFRSQTDPLDFGNKEIYLLNDSKTDISPLAFEVKGDEYWNPFVDGFSMDNENGSRDSLRKEDQNGFSHNLSTVENSNNEDKSLGSLENDPLRNVEALSHLDEEHSDNSFVTQTNLYMDKNVLEHDVPELMVCYKEINYHIVKDICVDEGMPVEEKRVNEGSENDHSSPQSPNESVGVVDMEFFTPDAMAAPSAKNSTPDYAVDECGAKEETHGKLIGEGRAKTSSDEITAEPCDLEDSVQQKDETNSSVTDTSHSDASEKESFVDRTLPIQEFGTRSFLRSFLNSLDSDGDSKFSHTPDQVSSDQALSGNPGRPLTEGESKEDVQASSLLYNSKVESGSITFNFNSQAPRLTGKTENVKDPPIVSEDVHGHKNLNSDDSGEAIQVERPSGEDNNVKNAPDQSLDVKNENTDDSSAVSCKSPENVPEHSPDLKNDDSDKHSASENIPSVVSKSQNLTNNDLNNSKHERRDSGNVSIVSQFPTGLNQLQRDEGESSFSASGLITYSGPIEYSGSLSVRSDGSATSARSFAFPVLQNEWNSSPVRMAKADRRHFRKHKGWRSGLLCCRF